VGALEVSERLWERAFQLSYYVLLDRSSAHECLAQALEKLAAQRSREKRRTYWRRRRKDLTIRRISRSAEDTLQWLVCLESEACEKEQESQGQPTEADMVVRYVKYLAQATTGSSSFHVNVGFNRLLRNYSTPEVQQLYELATVRYPAAEEYRKAKGKLLNQLAARFERFLRIRTGQHGELQFETHETHERWFRLVEECLEVFAPWSARKRCLQDGSELRGVASRPVDHGRDSASMPDRLETYRCHWFMHSICFGRLVEQLGFDSPRERLAVPRFLHHDGGDPGSHPASPERRTEPLSNDEIRILHERATAAADQGQVLALLPLRISAHGRVCATLDPRRDERCRFEIPEGTRLLEIRSDAAGESRALATHWIDYGDDNHFLPGEYTVGLQDGRQLALSVMPVSEPDGQPGCRAFMTVESCSTSSFREALRSFGSWFGEPDAVLRPALTSVVFAAVGVLVSSLYFGSRLSQDRLIIGRMTQEVASQKVATAVLDRAPKVTAQAIARYAFRSDASNLRGTGSSGEPVVTFAAGESLVLLELPVGGSDQGTYRVTLSSFPREQKLLSEPALRPIKREGHWVVDFALPATLVEGDTHYLLALTQPDGIEGQRYVFEVQKNSAITPH
jgi:hypothetical protein